MTRVYISYRSSDAPVVRHIYRRAVLALSSRSVLLNPEDSLPASMALEDYIDSMMRTCDAALIVIGPSWAGIDEYGRFLLSSADVPVQPEVIAALKYVPQVIPVLVNGIKNLPAPDELPENMHRLYDCGIAVLRPQYLQQDLASLIHPPSAKRLLQYGLGLEWLRWQRIG